jgi:hypothetical protein
MSSVDIWNDDTALIKALRERREEQKDRKKNTLSSSDQKKNQDMKMKIRKNSINPGEEMMRYFRNDVESELEEHAEKMAEKKGTPLSSMIPIPLPNYLRKQPAYPYQRKDDNIRGGVKKRRTKKGKNKKSKKQKVKRRTNKKRTNKKRKTRRSNKKR